MKEPLRALHTCSETGVQARAGSVRVDCVLQPSGFGKTSAPRMRDRPDGKSHLLCKNLPSGGRVDGRSLPNCRRILALCLGGIGDTVLAFAALRDLRRACPNDHITALAMWPQAAELLEDLGLFDVVLQHNFQTQPCRRSLWTALKQRHERYDASILAFPANRFKKSGQLLLS